MLKVNKGHKKIGRKVEIKFEDFEHKHYELTKGIFFSSCAKLSFCNYYYSMHIRDTMWNYAAQLSSTISDFHLLVEDINEFCNLIDRNPSINIKLPSDRSEWEDVLAAKDFIYDYTDAWLVFDRNKKLPQIKIPELEILRIDNFHLLPKFISVFLSAYSKHNKGQPYYLGREYSAPITFAAYLKETGRKVILYLGMFEGNPAACGMLICDGEYAGLYCLGVAPRFRGKRIGAAIHKARIEDARSMGCTNIFLQTEKDSYVERYGHEFGFETLFMTDCFTKK